MKARIAYRKLHNRHILSLHNVLGLIVLVISTVFLLSVFTLKQKTYTTLSASAPTFEELYGYSPDQHGPEACSGPCQLLVLSYYNSKASLLARLLMLMGVFAGDPEQLSTDVTNKLRGWELKQVTTIHDLMLEKYAAPGSPPHLAKGFQPSALSAYDLDYYQDRLQGILRYLDHHKPWLTKDPRLAWFAPLWLGRLEHPLCVIVVDLQPWLLAQQLSNGDGGQGDMGQEGVSAYVHLERWTNSTLSALQACFAVPTIIVPNTVLQPPLLQSFLAVLQQHLQQAGVPGIHMPSELALQQQYIQHLHQDVANAIAVSSCDKDTGTQQPTPAPASAGTVVDSTALLQDSCNWLPASAAATAKGSSKARGSSGGSGSAGYPNDLSIPTRALVEALVGHVKQHLAQPQAALDYNKVATRLFSAYSSRVKQLVRVQQGHGSHMDHHSVAELIHNALRYVSIEHKAFAMFRQQ